MVSKLNYIFERRDKIKIGLLLILITVGSFFELLGVSVFMPFINVIMNPESIKTDRSLSRLYDILHMPSFEVFLAVLAIGIGVIYLIKNIYLCLMQNFILKYTYKMRMNLASKLLNTYMNEPYTFHLSKNVAELQRTLQTDASQFMMLLNASLQMLAEVMVCFTLGAYLFHTSHSITVVIAIALLVCIGCFFFMSKKISNRLGQQNQVYNAKLIQWINQALGGIKEVKVLHREKFFVNEYKDNYKKLIHGAKTNELIATLPKYIVETVSICGMLLAVIIKIFFGRKDIADFIPQLSVFAVAAFRLLPSVGKMNAYINNIMYCLPSLNLIYNDLKEVEDYSHIKIEKEAKVDIKKIKKEISLCDIVYSYPGTTTNVIDHVSLKIKKGTTVALIGTSGAGKTTLADIILGLLPPKEGHIYVDDWDIYEHMDAWHHLLGYIPQTIYLSDDTIRNNIAFGISKDEIDDQKIEKALKKAQLFEFVNKLEHGLDTVVGDRGVRLSGGQRQRIGIARALYHEPDVLILDEATSALDNETEQAVMEAIESLQGIKTMIIIAHRLTTISKADEVYEVGNGKICRRKKEEVLPEK